MLNSIIPFSLICLRRICQSLVTSPSNKEEVATTTSLITMDPYKTYNLVDLFCHFITTRTHLLTFKTPPSPVYLYPFESRVLNEIKFLFRFVMRLISPNIDGHSRIKIRIRFEPKHHLNKRLYRSLWNIIIKFGLKNKSLTFYPLL